jgi:hypothetical protein
MVNAFLRDKPSQTKGPYSYLTHCFKERFFLPSCAKRHTKSMSLSAFMALYHAKRRLYLLGYTSIGQMQVARTENTTGILVHGYTPAR